MLLRVNRKTIVKKFIFQSLRAVKILANTNLLHPLVKVMEFDDLETSEHTKLKPLSITLAVEFKTRRILGFAISEMPAKGRFAKLSRAKYGPRTDKRSLGRTELFTSLAPLVEKNVLIKSDKNPHYPRDVKAHFPQATHAVFKGRKATVAGQGELKKGGFDPLFSLNHSCASLRANINRLFRRTWCTTKKMERLRLHIALYACFHNSKLKNTKR